MLTSEHKACLGSPAVDSALPEMVHSMLATFASDVLEIQARTYHGMYILTFASFFTHSHNSKIILSQLSNYAK